MSPSDSAAPRTKRILLRSGKSPFDVVPVEQALHRDVILTNAGNLIFSDASHKILTTPGVEVVSNKNKIDVNAAARINEEYDAFVVPLANAFRPSFEPVLQRMTQFIRKLRIPVVVLGVGAQAGLDNDPARLKPLEASVRSFVSAVLDHSASIGVRGEFTEQYLRNMGFRDVEVIGCPSLFMNGRELRVEKRVSEVTTASRIAINGSHSAVKGQGLDQIIRRTHERYPNLTFICQNLSDARQMHWRDMSDPNAKVTGMPSHPDHPMYAEDKVRIYIDPITWIDDLRGYDFSFGSRIHGNIAALLAGTPATVLTADSRTLELCRYFEIPHQRIDQLPDDLDPARLYEQADFSGLVGNHAERFDRFTGFLDKNGLENTFTHGDGGAAFEKKLRSLSFPPGIRPWLGEPAAVTERIGFLYGRVAALTSENNKLKRELSQAKSKAKAQAKAATAAAAKKPAPSDSSVIRRARRVVGRAFQSGR
ncbi:polysaccharide pyruvyl transferase family protein [Streptomyces sp. enrichment culture]|uniref:polysaccharide pyruvyl transferase family protein n=1 Tax=Streptomyces sp. enrichment culture TaxID=1795815 RepID=UPI003F566FA4